MSKKSKNMNLMINISFMVRNIEIENYQINGKLFEFQKVKYFGVRKDLKRGVDSASPPPPDRNGTLKFL